jgi:hypothetical protein
MGLRQDASHHVTQVGIKSIALGELKAKVHRLELAPRDDNAFSRMGLWFEEGFERAVGLLEFGEINNKTQVSLDQRG